MQKQIESIDQLYVYDSFNTFYVKYMLQMLPSCRTHDLNLFEQTTRHSK